ncbi:MAG TPA: hypothetical protein DIC32_06890 [Acinetobacter radioresistens]|uniref:Uncharacterized protein n=1 Tax=Acinetobacter radioresistens TaxID=40216 RepID=A0A3D3FZV6_ACIRA|nr:hypothetical protein [Acinetobacter radioresistens]
MFIKCKNIYNDADMYFNKEQIRSIEDLTTSKNPPNDPTLRVCYNKDDVVAIPFRSKQELDAFLKEALS